MDLDLGGPGSGGSDVQQLLEIETEALGFHAIAQDAKVQLTPAWPSEALPPPTASLLAVAPKRGLLAAGGPTSVVVASTEAARDAFKAQGTNNIKPFSPQLTIEHGIRISQVAFSSDESVLAISAEAGGGLAVFDVDGLLNGNTQSSCELPTGRLSLRALVPNPDEHPEQFAMVTVDGNLRIADVKAKQLSNPLKDNVSCVAWSAKGKQLVAGLLDGSALQITPTGDVKQLIPKPPGLGLDQLVSAISWLRNTTFFVVHGSTEPSDKTSTFHIIEKTEGNFQFFRLPETCGPWGMDRAPPHLFIQKMKDFPPDLKDVILLTSTTSDEVGLYTRSMKPLTANVQDPNTITGVFTGTTMAVDSRRAALPMADEVTYSSPIGMALDLSGKTTVHRPLPAEEMDESPTPLPALLILNNMGVLAGWWFAYADSIRTGTSYPGLAHGDSQQNQAQQIASPFGSSSTTTQPAFGQSAFGSSAIKPATTGFGVTGALGGPSASIFGQPSSAKPAQPTFGSSSMNNSKSAFGAPTTLGSSSPAFGSTSMLGGGAAKASPWGATANKAQFGNASVIGSSASPWAVAGSGNTSGTNSGAVFGQASTPSTQASIFGSNSQPATGSGSGSGFASFSGAGGFASLGTGPSVFASTKTPNTAFGSNTVTSIFGSKTSSDHKPFGSNNEATSIFGKNSDGNIKTGIFGGSFNVGSTWTNADAAKPASKPQETTGPSMFGSDFGKMLADTPKQSVAAKSEEKEMMDEISDSVDNTATPESPPITRETTTPAETPAPSKFFSAPSVASGLFGSQAQPKTTPAAESSSKPTPTPFSMPTIRTESNTDLPLPPDTTSKTTFTPTTSLATSTDSVSKGTPEAAPLPPDFVRPTTKAPPSTSPETTESTTPTAAEPVKVAPAKKVVPELRASDVKDAKSKPNTKATNPPPATARESVLAKAQKEVAKPISNQSKLFFSSEPDENEFVTTDEEAYDTEDAEHDGEDGGEEGEEGDEDDDGEEEDQHDGDEEDEAEEKDGEEEEGSGVDVAEEFSAFPSPDTSKNNSFGRQESNLTDGSWSNVRMSKQQGSQHRKDLFGEVSFPPKQPDNERSPSPERRAPLELVRSEDKRAVSAPNIAAKQKLNLPRTMKQAPKPAVSFEQRRKEEQLRLANKAAQQRAQEVQPLEDDEDDTVRRLLASPIEPSTELEPFIAHQDYTAVVSKAGIPGQIEKIYRDINSMIDTIGLNCRNIQAFTAGHEEGFKHGRELEDLVEPKNWTLVEVQDLKKLQRDLSSTLEEARISNVQEQFQMIRRLQDDITKLLAHQRDIRSTVDTQLEDVTNEEQYRDLDLSVEQQHQRRILRENVKTFQTKLMEVESAITMLRTKIATVTSASSKTSFQRVPTMEAVGNTVRKMTSKIEERSGDIDVLEARMRKLGIQASTPSSSRVASRESSPFATSAADASKHRASLLLTGNSVHGGSPLRADWRASTNGLGDSISSSTTLAGTARVQKLKKVTDYTAEDIEPFVRRAQRKKLLMGYLRDALVGRDGEKSVQVIGVE